MTDTMQSMSDVFTKAGEENCLILDNSNLDLGDFPYMGYLKKIFQETTNHRMDNFEFGYNQPGGGEALLQRIAEYESYLNQCEICKKDIVISGNGVTGVLNSLFHVWKRAGGGKILVPSPVYSAIPHGINYYGLQLRLVTTKEENDFLPVSSEIVEAYTNDVIAVILCNPGNPVCKYIQQKELINILNFCIEKNIYIVIDSIFEDAPSLHRVVNPYFNLVSDYKKFIKIKGISKEIPHASDLRIGWSISKDTILNEQLRYNNCMTNYSNSRLAEWLVYIEYEEKIKEYKIEKWMQKEKRLYRNYVSYNIERLCKYLEGQSIVSKVIYPDCGNIIYFKLNEYIKLSIGVKNAEELVIWIMENEKILFSPACYFFHDTDNLWIRITLCFNVNKIISALDRLFKHIAICTLHF